MLGHVRGEFGRRGSGAGATGARSREEGKRGTGEVKGEPSLTQRPSPDARSVRPRGTTESTTLWGSTNQRRTAACTSAGVSVR